MAPPKTETRTGPLAASTFMAGAMIMIIIVAIVHVPFDLLLPALATTVSEMLKGPPGRMLTEAMGRMTSAVLPPHVSPDKHTVVIGLVRAKKTEILENSFISRLVRAVVRIIQRAFPTPDSMIAVFIGKRPDVPIVLDTSLTTTVRVTGTSKKLKQLKKSMLQSDVWTFSYMFHELLPDVKQHWVAFSDLNPACFQNSIRYLRRARVRTSARTASCLKARLASTHRRRPVSATLQYGTSNAAIVAAMVLFESAKAAPVNDTTQKDVACIVPNMALASGCLADNHQDLSPEGKGIIALTVVLVGLTLVSVFFGVPQSAKDRLRTAWAWARPRQPHGEVVPADGIVPSGAVGDTDTVNAVAGSIAEEPSSTTARYWLGFIPVPVFFARRSTRISTRPVANTPLLRGELVAGVFNDVPEERSIEINELDEDLIAPVGEAIDGLELQDMTAANLVRGNRHYAVEHSTEGVRSQVYPRQGFDSTPGQATATAALETMEPLGQAHGSGLEPPSVSQARLSSESPNIGTPKIPSAKRHTC